MESPLPARPKAMDMDVPTGAAVGEDVDASTNDLSGCNVPAASVAGISMSGVKERSRRLM